MFYLAVSSSPSRPGSQCKKKTLLHCVLQRTMISSSKTMQDCKRGRVVMQRVVRTDPLVTLLVLFRLSRLRAVPLDHAVNLLTATSYDNLELQAVQPYLTPRCLQHGHSKPSLLVLSHKAWLFRESLLFHFSAVADSRHMAVQRRANNPSAKGKNLACYEMSQTVSNLGGCFEITR
jgi:hypothetical protein